nr:unnamed protein product [Spirometra erinaceieuropaei]
MIPKRRWQDRIPVTEFLQRISIICTHVILSQLQLRWGGRLLRIEETRLPKQLFYGDVTTGVCRPALPSAKQFGLPPPKSKGRLKKYNYLSSSVLTVNGFQHAWTANAHSAHESVPKATFGPGAPSTRQRLPLLPLSLLLQTRRRLLPLSPLIPKLMPHRHCPSCTNPCIDRSGQHHHQHHHVFTHSPHRRGDVRNPITTLTSAMSAEFTPALIANAHSLHTSA